MLRLLTSSGGIYLIFFAAMVVGWLFSKLKMTPDEPVQIIPSPENLLKNTDSLMDAIQHPNWRIRFAAAQAAAQSPDMSRLPELLHLLHDSDSDVREVAANALVRMGAPVVPFVRDHLYDSEVYCRETALRVLMQIDTDEARNGLIAALRDESSWIRLPAVQALIERHDTTSLEALKSVLDDPDEHIQETAKRALERFNLLQH